jgi:DNA-binding response OmpR family regulator
MDTKRIHILVVDDDADAADSTAELLALWGYDATARYGGASAPACVRVRRPAADYTEDDLLAFGAAAVFRKPFRFGELVAHARRLATPIGLQEP